MKDSHDERLFDLLESVRLRLLNLLALQFVLGLVAAFCGAGLWAVLLAHVGVPDSWLKLLVFIPLFLFGIFLVFRYLVYPIRAYRRPGRVAGWIEQRRKTFHDRLLSATELAQELRDGHEAGYSASLARHAVDGIGDDLERAGKGGFAGLRDILRPLATSLLTVVVAGALWFAWPGGWQKAWAGLASASSGADLLDSMASFLAGDIELTYTYPSYTGLETRVISNSSGAIEAYKGTRVTVAVTSSTNADEALLERENGEPVPLSPKGSRRFEGSFILHESDRYRFTFDGEPDARKQTIKLVADRVPQVAIDFPETELEVRDTDKVEVVFRAEDDFGLGGVTLVYNYDTGQGRKDVRVPIETFDTERRSHRGSTLWDLAGTVWRPGDQVSYFIEATDNDSVSGPKIGVSVTHYLKIFSIYEHHEKLIARQEEIWETMIDILGDHLENPAEDRVKNTYESISTFYMETGTEVNRRLVEPLRDVAAQMAEDPLSTKGVVTLLNNAAESFDELLREFRRRLQNLEAYKARLSNYNGEMHMTEHHQRQLVETLEKHIIALKDLIDKQRYDALVAETERLSEMREELHRLLKEYAATGDKSLEKELLQRIAQMKSKIAELMQKLAEMNKLKPEEFTNLKARQEQQLNDLGQVEDMIRQGNLDEALAELEQMQTKLEEMLSDMQETSDELQEDLFGEQARELEDFTRQVAQLENKQKELKNDTDRQTEEYRKKLERLMKNEYERLSKELAQKARTARKELDNLDVGEFRLLRERKSNALNKLEELAQLLENRDFGTSLDSAREAERRIAELDVFTDPGHRGTPGEDVRGKKVRKAAGAVEEIVEKLEDMMPTPDKLMGEKGQECMERVGGEQNRLAQEAMGTRRSLEELMQKMPMMDPEAEGQMRQAQQAMRQAGQELNDFKLSPAGGRQQEALHQLGKLKESLQETMKQMRSGQRPGKGRTHSGRRISPEKVAIPEGKQTSEDLLEIQKAQLEKAPKQYEGQIRSWYREMIKE